MELISSLNFSQSCVDKIPAISQSPTSSSSGFPSGDCNPFLNPTFVFHSGAILNNQEPTTAATSSSNLEGNPGFNQFQYFSAADTEGDTADCAPAPVLEKLSC